MRRSMLLLLAAATVVVALLAGRALATEGRAAPRSSTAQIPTRSTSEPKTAGPTRVDERGIPHGWPHDRVGAAAAAVSAVRQSGTIARSGFITRSDVIRSIATDEFGSELASLSSTQLEDLTSELGAVSIAASDLLWSEIPLTFEVVAADALAARVRVWSVLIVGVPDVGAPRQVWRTVTVDLAWESDDWLISGWTSTSGPTPLLASGPPISTTTAIDEVISWTPAELGGA